MRILWFTNTSGLISGKKDISGGWISSLQEYLEKMDEIELGLVFYSDHQMNPFRQGITHYFPVVRKGNTRLKRKIMQITGKVEKEENLSRFLEIIDNFKPDVIHVHGTENPFGLIIPHVNGIPVLVSMQGILNVIIKKYFSGVDSFRFADWRRNWDFFLSRNFTMIRKKAVIERRILSYAEYIAGRTDWDRRVTGILAPQARYFHIDESLRSIFYDSEWSAVRNKKFRIFSILSDQPYKGVHMLLETAIELHHSGFDFEWHVAGLDWGADMLRSFHRDDELSEVPVILRGRLPQDSIVNELKCSDCFVQVSQIENSSNSLAEAMMLGMPCIATAVGGTFTMLRDGVEGVLVPEGDPFCMAGSIKDYAANYEELIRMGKQARIRALQRHSHENITRQLMSAYKSVLAVKQSYHEV